MDYEKKYKEALCRAKRLVEKLESNHIKGFIYSIFPELKESEDGWCIGGYSFLEERQPRMLEYTRTDAFINKALKWYCLDCACNDNCAANHKCAFWSFFKDYLEGNDKALPPKISNAFNPDGSATENYRYRHIIERMQDDFIEKACEYLFKNTRFTRNDIDDFRKAMKG